MARQRGTGGTILAYIQEGAPQFTLGFSAPIRIDSLSSTMQNVVWNIADTAGNADATAIRRIGIEIAGTGGSPFTNPTVIYIDRVDVSSPAGYGSWAFDTSSSVYVTPTSSGPQECVWLNNHSDDTNVSGASISWLGP
jgi:hypothetical protein